MMVFLQTSEGGAPSFDTNFQKKHPQLVRKTQCVKGFRNLLVCFFICAATVSLHAQEDEFISNKLTAPPSPEAGQLGAYGELPVSLSVGTVNVNIPILNLQEGGISIPVSLAYQSHGLKVNERHSWVGMGWNLLAGGVISRTLRGKPDESLYGFLNKCTEIPNADIIAADLGSNEYREAVYVELDLIVDNQYDYVPDAFSFNFGNYSGSFYFGNDGIVHTTQLSSLKFEYVQNEDNDIVAWRVIDEAGFIYQFNSYETSQVSLGSGSQPEYMSAWYLTSIQNPLTSTIAEFSYDSIDVYTDHESTKKFTYEREDNGTYTPISETTDPSTYYSNNVKFLSKITLNDHIVTFHSVPALQAQTGENEYRKLIGITWSNGSSSRFYELVTDLFPTSGNTSDHKRLRLNSVSVDGKSYAFEYYPGNVPKRHDYGQDHWGFYNGKSNSSLVPDVTIGGLVTLDGDHADRSVDLASAKIGMLKKITYPTGGSSSFEYDQNGYEVEATEEDLEEMTTEPTISVDAYATAQPDIPPQYSPYRNADSKTIDIDNYNGKVVNRIDYKITVISVTGCVGGANSCPEYYIDELEESESIESDILTTTGFVEGTLTDSDFDITDRIKFMIVANQPGQTIRLDLKVYAYDSALLGEPFERQVGGLRVSKIENYDPVNDKTEVKTYDYLNGGYLVFDLPVYRSGYSAATAYSEDVNVREVSNFTIISSTPPRGLGPSSIPVSYQKVREWIGTETSNSGYILHTFFNQVDPQAAYSVQVSKSWKRSLPVMEQYFNSAGTEVKRVVNQYSGSVFKHAQGFRASKSIIWSSGPKDYENDFSYHNFYLETERLVPLSRKVFAYDSSIPLTVEEYFEYDSYLHSNITSKAVVDSNGDTLRTIYKYPIDDSPCQSDCYENYLIDLDSAQLEVNRHALEVQTCQTIWGGCNGEWFACHLEFQSKVNAECTNALGLNLNCVGRKLKNYPCFNAFDSCLESNGYEACLANVSNNFIAQQKMAFVKYRACQENYSICLVDEFDNEVNSDAKALAQLNSINRINIPSHVTSFKEVDEISRTDKQFISYDDSKVFPYSSSVTYRGEETVSLVTVNEYDGQGNPIEVYDHVEGITKTYIWGYKGTRLIAQIIGASNAEVSVVPMQNSILNDPASDAQLRSELAKLYQPGVLSGTRITTYTYDPINGLTSQTDSNGKVTTYTYDAFGKLLLIKDNNGHVIKAYSYNYIGVD